MVLLVCRYLGDNVGGGFVELVEVVLLSRRFLETVSYGCMGTKMEVRTSTVAW